jgi:delta 1-pyrroline-5-carboxylate dehydrogenase
MTTTEQAVEDLLSEQDWTGKIFSDGWVDAPETIETVEPATGEVLGTAGLANAASVAAATKSAARAQRGWAALPIGERVAVIQRAAEQLDLMLAMSDVYRSDPSFAAPQDVWERVKAACPDLLA